MSRLVHFSFSVLLLLYTDNSRAAARFFERFFLKRELKLLLSQQRKIHSFFITMMRVKERKDYPLTDSKEEEEEEEEEEFSDFSFFLFVF